MSNDESPRVKNLNGRVIILRILLMIALRNQKIAPKIRKVTMAPCVLDVTCNPSSGRKLLTI